MSVVAFTIPSFAQNIITNDEVYVTITGETTREELGALREQLLTVGVDFKYYPGFNSDRKLMSIRVEFTADADHVGTGDNPAISAAGQKLQFHMKKENGAITTWCVGTCEQ
jgi:hypothetical protein